MQLYRRRLHYLKEICTRGEEQGEVRGEGAVSAAGVRGADVDDAVGGEEEGGMRGGGGDVCVEEGLGGGGRGVS